MFLFKNVFATKEYNGTTHSMVPQMSRIRSSRHTMKESA